MTDQQTTDNIPYVVPPLTVRATYPATDGRVPEEIVIEFGGDGPVDHALVDRAVDALARVAACRDAGMKHTFTVSAGAGSGSGWTRGAAGAPLVDTEALADAARREAAQRAEATA